MTTTPGGYGREAMGGGLMGGGGPITVARAVAVAGQVVRVVFSEEPVHVSPAGAADALNPSNYIFAGVTGALGIVPTPVGVDAAMVVGPAYLVGNGGNTDERGFDVHTDVPLVLGVQYRVTARNIKSLAGGDLGFPSAADFFGVTLLKTTRPQQRQQDLVDLMNPPALGHWVVDDSGDIAPEDPDAGTRKRIFRRLMTPRNAYRFLNDYGAGLALKAPMSIAELSERRARALQQVKAEPDVAAASVSMSLSPLGIVTVQVKAKTRRGTYVDVGATVTAVGQMSMS